MGVRKMATAGIAGGRAFQSVEQLLKEAALAPLMSRIVVRLTVAIVTKALHGASFASIGLSVGGSDP